MKNKSYQGLPSSSIKWNDNLQDSDPYKNFMGQIPGYNPQKPRSAKTATPAQQPFKTLPIEQIVKLSPTERAKYEFEASKPEYEKRTKEQAELGSINRQKQQYEADVQNKYEIGMLQKEINLARQSGDYQTAARLSDQLKSISSSRGSRALGGIGNNQPSSQAGVDWIEQFRDYL